MTEESLRVRGCPYCEIFIDSDVPTKLYYPKESKIKEEDDFIIISNDEEPAVIISEHTTDIGTERWGRILYKARELFGGGIRLRIKMEYVQDHWHCKINNITKDPDRLPDLRGE